MSGTQDTGNSYRKLFRYTFVLQNTRTKINWKKNIKIRTFTKVLIILKTKLNSVIPTKTKTKIFLDKLINIVIHQSISTLILITYYFLVNLEYS